MRFLTIYTPDAKTVDLPPTPEHMEAMGKFMEVRQLMDAPPEAVARKEA